MKIIPGHISIIIPCYNQGVYIKDAIDSVLAQTYADYEIVVVNDGSDDKETADFLSVISDSRIKVIHTENHGLSSARNTGIANSLGEFILPLDADDKIASTYIASAIRALQKNNELKLVYCEGRYFGKKNEPIQNKNNPFCYKTLLLYNMIFCSAIFRKTDFLSIGGYNVLMRKGWEDWDLWIRLLQKDEQVYQIPEELFYYRIKTTSMITEVVRNNLLRVELEEAIFQNNIENYYRVYGPPISILRELENLRAESLNFEKVKKQIYSTLSYRIGHFILKPFKLIRKIGK